MNKNPSRLISSASANTPEAISRRDFLLRSALSVGGAAMTAGAEALPAPPAEKTKVVVVTTTEKFAPGQNPPLALVEKMVEKGVTVLAGKNDPMRAWASFVRPTDHVCLPTAGGQLENIPEVNIAVYRALATLGVNKMTVGTHRMSGKWHDRVAEGMKERMPDMITDKLFGIANLKMDSLVVTPTVKHHDIAGVSGTLKLYACFSKKGPWNYHGETPHDSPHWDGKAGGSMGACGWVPANDFKEIRKLHIVDMLRIGSNSRGWTAHADGWVYTRSLVFAVDPVAADRVAFDIYLKVAQASGRLDPWYHVERADQVYKAGVSDRKKIDVRRITV